ncbi:cation transporter [Desulfitobacterium metallireducens DSM 15288]|uniref:Cation transporter n=2 Tax=Desulfitobacterium TaxID=36853 RepID=W0EES3_9FIRM|nr:DUF1646 family protein [Desulfitobacterium metallireducens]AHF08028.1 cation transporter [Desulfitobacterium metallireducens DSM 15288]
MYGGLGLIILLVLVLPFTIKKVEQNLEFFLFVMGLLSVLISQQMTLELFKKALEEPIMITAAVLGFGIIFKIFKTKINHMIQSVQRHVPARLLMFLIVLILGLMSSVITAIIAALLLVEIVNNLKLDRTSEVALVIISCFAIGLGAALTPIGEPLATIVISKLHADFWYLFRNFGELIVPAIIALGLFAAFFIRTEQEPLGLESLQEEESYKEVVLRALKIYLFVMALTFLGTGLKPIIDRFILGLPSQILYWINMISAILDNATLAAAEISDKMSLDQIMAILLGLLISGGMLIPGNIPNIIAASKLNIQSKEWARLGVPVGLVIMVAFYGIIFYLI